MVSDDVEALVVGGMNLGEADRIVYLLSDGFGRTRAVARGARKSKKRFAGMLDPGCHIRLTRRGRQGSLASITDIELVRAPRHAREDLDRIALLAYGCEICASLAAEEEPAPRQYGLLQTWLLLLEGAQTPGVSVRVALEAKALTFAGFTPALVQCSRCGLPLEDPCVFDPESGGGLHQRCGSGQVLRAEVLRTIEALRRTPMRDLVDNPVDVPTKEVWLMSNFIRYQLGRGLKSRALLEDLAQMNPRR